MNFLDQPRELIISEQLVRLPIKDLLTSCRVNPLFDQLCQDPDLWLARIRNDYPGVNWHAIENPREFYLRQVLFGGQIYVHLIDYGIDTPDDRYMENLSVQTSLMSRRTIAYDDLFVDAKKTADTLLNVYYPDGSRKYLIIYSRPSTNSEGPALTPIAYQDEISTQLMPGPAQKITLVDILFLYPGSNYLDFLAEIRENQDKLLSIQPKTITNLGGYIAADVRQYQARISTLLQQLDKSNKLMRILIEYHRRANTLFYQQELDFAERLSEKLFESRVRVPMSPPFSSSPPLSSSRPPMSSSSLSPRPFMSSSSSSRPPMSSSSSRPPISSSSSRSRVIAPFDEY